MGAAPAGGLFAGLSEGGWLELNDSSWEKRTRKKETLAALLVSHKKGRKVYLSVGRGEEDDVTIGGWACIAEVTALNSASTSEI